MTRTPSLIPLAWVSLGLAIGAVASPGETVADEEVEAQQQAQYQELDRYFDRQVNEADRQRARSWRRNFSSIEDYEKSVEPWRAKLFEMLGGNPYPNSPLRPQEQLIAEFPTHKAYRVWFTAFDDVRTYGDEPRGARPACGGVRHLRALQRPDPEDARLLASFHRLHRHAGGLRL